MIKTNSAEQQKTPDQASLPPKELQDARQVVNTFLLAWKNYGLYPEEHAASKRALENLVRIIADFTGKNGDLRLTVEKDRLFYDSEVIYQVSPEAPAEDIISLLYRDGIKWFEFQHGLNLDELACFFKIAYKYRIFAEETEGDIVTSLMDEEPEHLDFKAVDIFWQDLLLIDFSQLNTPQLEAAAAAPEDKTEFQGQTGSETDQDDIQAESIAAPSRSKDQFELSYEEFEKLQQMVLEEENWDNTADVFDVLLVIIKSQTEPEKFSAVLDFTFEEAVATIGQGEFGLLLNLFQSFERLFPKETSPDQAWIRPLIDRFFEDLSTPDIFKLLTDRLIQLTDSEIDKVKALGRALLYFSPEIVLFIGPAIKECRTREVRQMAMNVIEYLSRIDLGPFEKLAKKQEAELGEYLLIILDHLEGDRVNNIYLKLSEHPSEKVRRKAIRELVARDPRYVQKLFSLIDDPSREIRNTILAAAAKQRSTTLENLLLNYLRENGAQKDAAHVLACYKALGRCGSNRSLAFLRGMLLDKGWNSFMGSGKLLHRERAATALALLDTKEAGDILQTALKSRFKVVREAARMAVTGSYIPGEKTDD